MEPRWQANFTSRFRLEGPDADGHFTISNTQILRLPPYPFQYTDTLLYATVVCNGEAYPLVTIRVKTSDSHAPYFYQTPYHVSLSEAVPLGTEIDTPILAIDWDPAHDYPITFSIEDNDSPFSLADPISVHGTDFLPPEAVPRWSPEQLPTVVRLRVDEPLDFDTQPNSYVLTIVAKDNAEPPNTNRTRLVVHLLDADDQQPRFTSEEYLALIPKKWSIGSSLTVTPPLHAFDGDLGINKSIIYSIDANAMDALTIDAQSGEITLIDEGAAIPDTIVVKATQSDHESRFATARLRVVSDLPQATFDKCEVYASLLENTAPGTPVVEISVLHRTEKSHVKLIDPDGTFALKVDPTAPSKLQVIVKNSRLLDRELFSTIEAVLQLEDSTPSVPQENSCQKVKIRVDLVDENDNAPVFERDVLRYWVGDQTHDGDILATLRASDKDQGPNGDVSYSLIDPAGQKLPLEIQQANGAASLLYVAALDKGERQLNGALRARDHGQPEKYSEIPVEIYRRKSAANPLKDGLAKGKVTAASTTRQRPTVTHSQPKTTTTEAPRTTNYRTTAETTTWTPTAPEPTTTSRSSDAPEEPQAEEAPTSSEFLWRQIEFLRQNGIIAPTDVPSEAEMTGAQHVAQVFKPESNNVTEPFRRCRICSKFSNDIEQLKKKEKATVAHAAPTKTAVEGNSLQDLDGQIEKEEDGARELDESVEVVALEDTVDEHPPESSLEEAETMPPQFQFHEDNYKLQLFGPVVPGEGVGRVAAGPGVEAYGIDRRVFGQFTIDFDGGLISVDEKAEALFKQPGTFRFHVSATDGVKTAQSWVSVQVDPTKSIFAAAPRFDQSSYEIFVTENQPPAVISTLRAFHRSEALHQDRLVYSILTSDKDLPFSVEANTGQLAVLNELDRENGERYDFQVRACLSEHRGVCGVASVSILVNDLNDNTPKFPSNTYHIVVPNDLPKGAEVVQLAARDMDAGSNGVVSYVLNPPSETFAIDHHTGQISILRTPEKSRYSLIIEAFDHGIPRRTTHTELRINVEGSNPSAPQFDQSGYTLIVESPVRVGQVIGNVHATDPDPGEDGMVTYSFGTSQDPRTQVDQQKFSINPKTGAVSALTPLTSLDGPFHLVAEASDQNAIFSRKTKAAVRVEISGSATLRFFPLQEIVYISSEKQPGSVILRASAHTSGSSDINFLLVDAPEAFAMDGDLLKVVQPLAPGETNLTIRAETESTHVEHVVRVVVMNDRDKYPVFPKLSYDLEIPLETRFPILLHRFAANVENGTVQFALYPPNRVPGLTIDEDTGTLIAGKDYIDSRLNRDTVFVVVRATNRNYPRFYSDVGVSISLVSTASRLRFSKPLFKATVRENTRVGSVLDVGKIEMQSAPANTVFTITPASPLTILPNGSIIVNDDVDLEKLPVDENDDMLFVVTASDGEQSVTAKLQLNIEDVNEFLPRFDYLHYQAHIGEGALPGTPIVKVRATDKDFSDTKLEYRINGGSGVKFVKIQQDGTLTLVESLDREKMAKFDVVIEAVDSGGNSAEAKVDVDVLDANDNAPRILNQPLIWNVPEGEASLGAAFEILTSDLDEAENAQVTYALSGGNEGRFFELIQKSPVAAVLKIVKPLNRAQQAAHVLSIEVKDHGHPSMMSVATVTVNVKSEGRRLPQFPLREYKQAVPADMPANFNILQVAAEDIDVPVQYSISGGEACHALKIGPKGEVAFATNERPEDLTRIECTVEVSDGSHSDSTRLVVNLEKMFAGKPNRPNHPPKFAKGNYVFRVNVAGAATGPEGLLVGQVSAIDNDGDLFNYSIEPVEFRNLFEVDNQGQIWLRSVEALGESRSMSFLAVATDKGQPQLASFTNVRVTFHQLEGVQVEHGFSRRPMDQIVDEEMPSSGTQVTRLPDLETTVFTVSDEVKDGKLAMPQTVQAFPNTQWSSSTAPSRSRSTAAETEIPHHMATHQVDATIRPTTAGTTTMWLATDKQVTGKATTQWTKVEGGSEGDSEDEATEATTLDAETSESQDEEEDTSRPFENADGDMFGDDTTTSGNSGADELHFRHALYYASMPEGRYSNGALLNLKPEPLQTNGEEVTYTISDSRLPFHIRGDTGELAIMDVDREKSPFFAFRITATDSRRRTATTVVNVTILDVNDNYPLFVSPPLFVGLPTNIAPNVAVDRLQAIDADEGRNAEVTYELEENPLLAIDARTGSIRVKSPLSPSQQPFEVKATAKDGGRPGLRTTHTPLLPTQSAPVVVPYPASPNHFVTQLLGGPTAGQRSEIQYRLAGDEHGLFTIDEEGRVLLARQPAPADLNKYHQISVRADNALGTDQTTLNVFLSGTGGAPPRVEETRPSFAGPCSFPTKLYNAQIAENREGRHKLSKVTSDCESAGAGYEYTIWQGADQFEVDEQTGEVFVNGPLDREKRSVHFIFINVTRPNEAKAKRQTAGNPVIEYAISKLSAWQALVVVRVLDSNDNSPQFVRLTPEGQYSGLVAQQAPPLTPILRMQAQDADEKTQLVYGIQGGDQDAFRLNSTTGILTLAKIIHEDSRTIFRTTGTVSDGSHTVEIPVTVHKLTPASNLVYLTLEKRMEELDEKEVEKALARITNTEIHVLTKEPFTNSQGQVDPNRSVVHIYGLEPKSRAPVEKNRLKGLLDKVYGALQASEARVSSISLAPSSSPSLSTVDAFLLFICLVLVVIALVVCCLVASLCKRRDAVDGKDYMRSSSLDGPRPYDVSVIPRATAQAVLAGRPLPDPMQFSENKQHSPSRISADDLRSTNRSDELLVFANSVRDTKSRASAVSDESGSDRGAAEREPVERTTATLMPRK
ncbi:unnamed protein product, partial [Mesorhabditis spiculigera]